MQNNTLLETPIMKIKNTTTQTGSVQYKPKIYFGKVSVSNESSYTPGSATIYATDCVLSGGDKMSVICGAVATFSYLSSNVWNSGNESRLITVDVSSNGSAVYLKSYSGYTRNIYFCVWGY